MKYNKNIIIYLISFMISNIYAQDNIINEIAKGGKFIVRDDKQNEAMVIEEGNVWFSGTLKLDVLPKGDIGNSVVVWDSEDKLLKLQDQSLSISLTTNIKDESWHSIGYDGLADDNITPISASMLGTVSVKWNEFNTDYGYIKFGPANSWYAHIYTNKPAFIFNKPFYSMTGNYNSYLNINLTLLTWRTPRLTILHSNGNVGIGTINPATKLEVAGQVKITGGAPGYGKVLTSNATGLASWQTPAAGGGGSTLWTESGSNIYRNSGNIGIGTANPSAKLEVKGSAIIGDNASSSFLHVGDNYNSSTANSLNPGVYVYKNGPISYGLKLQWTGSEYGTMMFGPNSANRFLSFGKVGSALEDDDMIEYMRIDLDNGNVGIGTANPGAKLDVAGQVKITGGSPGSGKVLTSDATGLATWQTAAAAAGGGSTLWTESGSNIYRNSGKVGIGTASPLYNLDVNGTTSAKRYVVNGIYNITGGVWDLSKSNLAQITYNSNITPITINSDGSVGTYILVVKKNSSCTDCNIIFSGATVKYTDGVNPTLSSGSNTTDIFSFIAVGNNTFYCLDAKNLK